MPFVLISLSLLMFVFESWQKQLLLQKRVSEGDGCLCTNRDCDWLQHFVGLFVPQRRSNENLQLQKKKFDKFHSANAAAASEKQTNNKKPL